MPVVSQGAYGVPRYSCSLWCPQVPLVYKGTLGALAWCPWCLWFLKVPTEVPLVFWHPKVPQVPVVSPGALGVPGSCSVSRCPEVPLVPQMPVVSPSAPGVLWCMGCLWYPKASVVSPGVWGFSRCP